MLPINDKRIEEQSAFFQKRNEPNFAWGNAISGILALPKLRAFWPMSSVDENSDVYDISGQGRVLTQVNTPVFGAYALRSYVLFNGTTQYLFRADEAGLDFASSPLTIGIWFYPTNLTGVKDIVAKDDGVGQRQYALYTSGTTLCALVNGAALNNIVSTNAISLNAWNFMLMRYTPSAELAVYLNGTWSRLAAGIIATIGAGTAQFRIGANAAIAPLYHAGYASLCFPCAYAVEDVLVENVYQQTRALFGR